VFAVGRPEISQLGRMMAAILASGPGAVLSHLSAGGIWGISAPAATGLTEITVPAHRKPHPAGVRIHRRSLNAPDLGCREGIPVTSPIRTLLDLSGRLPAPRLEAAVVAADQLDLVDAGTLRSRLDGLSGEHGVAALRSVLDRRTFAIAESELERRFLSLARRTGLPLPETGARVHGLKLDFLWRELGLAVETDGLRYHRTPAQQARDRRRDQTLAAAGLTPLRFTYEQVTKRPAEVERTLRAVADRLGAARGATPRRTSGRSR
jgi:very-short-patch-repair endonuclease